MQVAGVREMDLNSHVETHNEYLIYRLATAQFFL